MIAFCRKSLCIVPALLLFVLCLGAATGNAATISGTVADPSGALIPGVRIEITGGSLTEPVVISSDNAGRFSSPDLKPGTYTLQLVKDGFAALSKTVELKESATLQLSLAISREHAQVNVTGKASAYANSDPVYRGLR